MAIPSPRNIPEFRQKIEEIFYKKIDVLWIKYFPEIEAYRRIRNYFLNSPKKYDYLLLIPDDLILNQEGFDLLLQELDSPSLDMTVYDNRYPVLSGICNFSNVNPVMKNTVAASIHSVTGKHLLTFDQLAEIKDNVIRVSYTGFMCELIHRSVVEEIEFQSGQDLNLGIDMMFSNACVKRFIPQFILKTARFTHLKGLNAGIDTLLVGKVKPSIIFANGDTNH